MSNKACQSYISYLLCSFAIRRDRSIALQDPAVLLPEKHKDPRISHLLCSQLYLITVLRQIVYFLYFVSLHALSPIWWSPKFLEKHFPPIIEFVKMWDHAFSKISPHCCRCQSNSWGLLGNHLTAVELCPLVVLTLTKRLAERVSSLWDPKTGTKQVTRHKLYVRTSSNRKIKAPSHQVKLHQTVCVVSQKNDTSTPSTPSTPKTHPDNHCMTISACMKAVGGQNWAQPARPRSRSFTPQGSLPQRHWLCCHHRKAWNWCAWMSGKMTFGSQSKKTYNYVPICTWRKCLGLSLSSSGKNLQDPLQFVKVQSRPVKQPASMKTGCKMSMPPASWR